MTGATASQDRGKLAVERLPDWPGEPAWQAACAELRTRPPLIYAEECDRLTALMAEVAEGKAFLLQGGDRTEIFGTRGSAAPPQGTLRTLLQMNMVLTHATGLPTATVIRIAGQYGPPGSPGIRQPQSSPREARGDVRLHARRGGTGNGRSVTTEAGHQAPDRLRQTYQVSAATLNLLRAMVASGDCDLGTVEAWNRAFVQGSPAGHRYAAQAGEITRALRFMRACGARPDRMTAADVFTSHETQLLDYESALTRPDSRAGNHYGTSAHLLWLGERARRPDGAHVKYASTVRNPLAVTLGPDATSDEVLALTNRLNPYHEPGRLTFVARMGAGRVRHVLPELVDKARASGTRAAWVCDPVSGNTLRTSRGRETRRFDDIVSEVRGFFEVHRSLGTQPGGMHIELADEEGTEGVGDGDETGSSGLHRRDEFEHAPRLSRAEALELAFVAGELYRSTRC